MRVARPTLLALLENNVVELKFNRRRVKPGFPPTRRMLGTNSQAILLTENGFKTLNYTPPAEPVKFNPAIKNIVTAWDIMMQGFRSISAEEVEVITVIPANDEFWPYFNENILPMTPEQKQSFINS